MLKNIALAQQGFRILQPLMAGYIGQEMRREYGNDWRQEAMKALSDQLEGRSGPGGYPESAGSLDIADCLRLFDRKWDEVFREKLSPDYRIWGKKLMGVCNTIAHAGAQDFSDNDIWSALDTMARLCKPLDSEAAGEINALLRKSRYGSDAGYARAADADPAVPGTKKAAGRLNGPVRGLPGWREVIQPHPDVAQGRYKNAEFAADLAQVARGEGAFEYRDPVEFFGRTYVTEGMKGLLVQGLKRVSGRDGEPVVRLKTAFGGGKTHSMLALWHLMRAKVPVDKIPNIRPVLEEIGRAHV